MEDLGGMEAAGGNITVRENGIAINFNSEGMRPVVDDFEVMLLGDPVDCLHIAGNSIHMRSKDGGSMRSDGSFYFLRIDVAGIWIYIHKDRFASFPDDAAGSGHIGKRRGDDLAFEFQGLDGNLNGDGPVSCVEQMINPKVFLQIELQFIDQRAIVGQPVPLPYPIEIRLVFSLRREEGFGDGDQGWEDFRCVILDLRF